MIRPNTINQMLWLKISGTGLLPKRIPAPELSQNNPVKEL
jgi:hypothetical protein